MSREHPVIMDAMAAGRRYQGRQAGEQLQWRENERGLPGGEWALQAVDPGLPVPPGPGALIPRPAGRSALKAGRAQ
jgi:hypothetical protein